MATYGATVTTETRSIETRDGRRLCVDSAGDGSGRPVLIHSGTPGSRHILESYVRDAEAAGVHLLKYDRPGYGLSTAHPGHTVADCANDVRDIARAFKIERLAVWGASGGGPRALACAALLPDLVTSAAALASLAPYGAEGLDFFAGMGQANSDGIRLQLDDPDAARVQSHLDRDAMLAVTADQMLTAYTGMLPPIDASVLTFELAVEGVLETQQALEPGAQGWWDDSVAQLAPWGFDLGDIRIPVQVWHGVQDRFVPVQHGRWLATHVPGADVHILDNEGHLSLNRHVPEVHRWLTRHD